MPRTVGTRTGRDGSMSTSYPVFPQPLPRTHSSPFVVPNPTPIVPLPLSATSAPEHGNKNDQYSFSPTDRPSKKNAEHLPRHTDAQPPRSPAKKTEI